MNRYSLPFLVLVALASVFLFEMEPSASPQQQFEAWMAEFGKSYDQQQFRYRFSIFTQTLATIQSHNAKYQKGEESYSMGLNSFSDLTDEEYKEKYLLPPGFEANFQCDGAQAATTNLTDTVDWSSKGAVTSVRNVGSCKSSYAISTIETIETTYFRTKNFLNSFSAQQIIDCSGGQGNKGCDSGNALNSLAYIKTNGLSLESNYPYTGKKGTCAFTPAKKTWEMRECVKVTPDKQLNLKGALKNQTVAVSINADKIKNYKSGVFESGFFSSCKTDPNHWMTLVGYGTLDGKKYWKLKNSMGTSWGVNGYLLIIRKGDGEGECGVQHEAYFTR